jgi:hypothetical protein
MGDSGGGPKTEAEKARDRVKLLMGELVDTEKSMLDSLALFDPPPELLNEKYPAIVQYNDHVKAIVKSGAPVFELFNELNSNLDNPNFDLVAYHKRLKDAMDVHAENLAKAVIGADAFMKEIAELQKADAKKPLPVNIRDFLFVSIKPAVEAKPADKALGTPEVLAVPQRRVDTAMALGIMAIQRLPRYEMLSKEMIKNTPPEMQERVPFLIRDSENKIIPLSTYAQNANERTRLHEALKELNKVKGTKSAFKSKDYGMEKNKITLDAQDKIKNAIQNQYLDKIGVSQEELTTTLMYLNSRTHDSEMVPMSTLPNGRIEEAKPGNFYLDNDGNYVVIDPQGKLKSGNLKELGIPEEDIKKMASMDKDPNFKQRLLKVISDKGLIRKNKGKRKEEEASLLETMNLNIDDKPSIITISLSKENLNKPDKVSKALDVALKLKEKGVKVHFSDTFNEALTLPKNKKFEKTINLILLLDASKEGQEIENKTEAESPTRVSISGDVPVAKGPAAGGGILQPSAATLREQRAASMESLAAKKVSGVTPSPLQRTEGLRDLKLDQSAAKPAAATSTQSGPPKVPQTSSEPPLRIKLPVSEKDVKKPVASASADPGATGEPAPRKPSPPPRPPLQKSGPASRDLTSNPVKEFQAKLSNSTSTTNTVARPSAPPSTAESAVSNKPKPPSHPAPKRPNTPTITSNVTPSVSTTAAPLVSPSSTGSKLFPPSGRPTLPTGVSPSGAQPRGMVAPPVFHIPGAHNIPSRSDGATAINVAEVNLPQKAGDVHKKGIREVAKLAGRKLTVETVGSKHHYMLAPPSGFKAESGSKEIYDKVAADTIKMIRDNKPRVLTITPHESVKSDLFMASIQAEMNKPENRDLNTTITINIGNNKTHIISAQAVPDENAKKRPGK